MPGSYRAGGIVLRRTKLGEQDLIVTLLGDGARQLRVVCKGARKPGSRLAGLVNLGNEVDLLLHRGRGLDVATEGQLVVARADVAREFERSAMAEAVLDVACELTVEGEHNRLLLPLTSTALDAVCAVQTPLLPLAGAAYVLKAAAMQGYRPSLDVCVACGSQLGGSLGQGVEPVAFSFADGGAVCGDCAASGAFVFVEPGMLAWCRALLGMRFGQVAALEPSSEALSAGLDVLGFCRGWLAHYPGVRPRALDFVIDRGVWSL